MGYGWIFVGSFMGKDNQKPLMLNTIIYGWKIFNYQPTKCQWVYIYNSNINWYKHVQQKRKNFHCNNNDEGFMGFCWRYSGKWGVNGTVVDKPA